MLYLITRAAMAHLDSTEGVPGRRYRHLGVEAEDIDGNRISAVTYIADGKEKDGRPSLRYITLLRDGARDHGLPDQYIRFLDAVEHARYRRRFFLTPYVGTGCRLGARNRHGQAYG